MEYAKRMLDALSSEVLSLSNEVGECAQLLADCAKEFDERMKRRCTDEGGDDVTRVVVRFYKPQAVKDFEKRLRLDDSLQKQQTAAVRQRLTELLGEERRFGLFGKKLAKGVLLEELEQVCEASAIQGHEDLVGRDRALAPILKVSIVEKLYREYSGNPEGLRSYAHGITANAKTFLALDGSEVSRRSSGIPPTPDTNITFFTVLMPDAAGHEEFAKQLGSELIGAAGFGGDKKVIENPLKPNEITLVTVRNVMPARFAASVVMLRKKYEARMKDVKNTPHALELHGEGDGTQFPSLFVRSVQTEDVRPYVLIARVMGLIQEFEDRKTEEKKVWLVTKDEHGLPNPPQDLGATLDHVLREAGQALLDQLQDAIQKLLATEFLAKSKRDEVMAQIRERQKELLNEAGGNPTDSEYRKYAEAAKKAEEILAHRR